MSSRDDAAKALRIGMIDRLSANTELTALIGADRVWEYIDEDLQMPYVQIINDDDQDWSFSQVEGNEHQVTVHVYHDTKAASDVEDILQIVKESLHNATFDITSRGHRLVNLRFVSKGVLRDEDEESYHGFARYRATTEEV